MMMLHVCYIWKHVTYANTNMCSYMQLILLRSIKSINKCMFNKALVTKTTKHFFESAAQNVFANAN